MEIDNNPDMTFVHRIILETDANVIAGRVAMRGADADVPFSEQVYIYAIFMLVVVCS